MKRTQQDSDGFFRLFGVFCICWLLVFFWSASANAELAEQQKVEICRKAVHEFTRNWNRLEIEGQPWEGYSVRMAADYAYVLLSADVYLNDHSIPLERLERLFALVREMQDTNPQSKFHGNFRWYWGQDSVKDPNAIEFVLQRLLYCKRHEERLSESARSQLNAILRDSVQCELLRDVKSSYTNIAVQNLANLILLGELLENPAALEEGKRRLDRFLCHTYRHGISEYSTSVYYVVDICALAFLECTTQDAEIRQKARALLDYWVYEVAFMWFQLAHRLAGAYSRTYHYDEADPNLLEILQCWGWETLPERFTPTVRMLDMLNCGFFPANPLKDAETTPRWFQDGSQRATYITPRFAMGYSTREHPDAQNIAFAIDLPKRPRCCFISDIDENPYGVLKTQMKTGHSRLRHFQPDTMTASMEIPWQTSEPEGPQAEGAQPLETRLRVVPQPILPTESGDSHVEPGASHAASDSQLVESASQPPESDSQPAESNPLAGTLPAASSNELSKVPEPGLRESPQRANVPAVASAVSLAGANARCTLGVRYSANAMERLPNWDTLKQKKLQSHFIFPLPDEIRQNGVVVPLDEVEKNQEIHALSLRYGQVWIHVGVRFEQPETPAGTEPVPVPVVHCVNDDPVRQLLRLTVEHGLLEYCDASAPLTLTFEVVTEGETQKEPPLAVQAKGASKPGTASEEKPPIAEQGGGTSKSEMAREEEPPLATQAKEASQSVPESEENAQLAERKSLEPEQPTPGASEPSAPLDSHQPALLLWSGPEVLRRAVPEVESTPASLTLVNLQVGETQSWAADRNASCCQLFRTKAGILVNDEVRCLLTPGDPSLPQFFNGTYEIQLRASATDAKHNSGWMYVNDTDVSLVEFPPTGKSTWSKPVTFRLWGFIECLHILPREFNVQLEEIRIRRVE